MNRPHSSPRRQDRPGSRAFTVLELLVAFSVLALIIALVSSMTSHVARVTTSSPAPFQEARTAFETMNRLLSQAVLNTYWDYDKPGAPDRYVRASELQFVMGTAAGLTSLSDTAGSAVFFQAPLGKTSSASLKKMPDLLNGIGFYVRFSTSPHLPPYLQAAKPGTAAYRLWMYQEPTEDLKVYQTYNGKPQAASDLSWFQGDLSDASRNHVLANNIILLLLRCSYRNSAGELVESYLYDSRPVFSGTATQPVEMHQIPPTLRATLVAIDERTAGQLLKVTGTSYNLIDGDLFIDATKYAIDIATLQDDLNHSPIGEIPIQYRIFEETINVSSSKWSR